MNSRERYLAVYDDNERKKLDRVPTHVQYIMEEFITHNKENILSQYGGKLFNNLYFDIPLILGFDSIFAPFPLSFKVKSIKVHSGTGKIIRIKEDGQSTRRKTSYYEGGYINNLEVLNELITNLKKIDNNDLIKKAINFYDKISPYIFPVLIVDGIFDRVWRSMGLVSFSRNLKKNTKLFQELIKFYANLVQINIEGLINATGGKGKIINILDDVAYKGHPMISPERWEKDFLPHYKELTSIISDAGMIPQVHTDGDVTELISSFKKAGFRGLQGFEGGCDPYYVNEHHPDFVIVGFGDVSYTLPYGTQDQIESHVRELMNALKENRRFVIGPSTVIFKEIPIENVRTFVNAAIKYGKYIENKE